MKKIWGVIAGCGMAFSVCGQESIISESSVERRALLISNLPVNQEKAEAETYAARYGLPVRRIDRDGNIIEIQRLIGGRHPLYNETHNINAARTVSTSPLWDGAVGGFHLRGKNILVAVWDGGKIRTTHVEFGSRAYSLDSGFEIVGHSTHVAGTIGARGLDPRATGMAGQCFIEGYDWDSDVDEMRMAAGDGLLISNHSYGYIHGFDYNQEERRWEWYGDREVDEEEDYNFGFYSRFARAWDDVAHDHPHYLIVKSAGNDRLEGPPPGSEHYVLERDWVVSTTVRNRDGGPDGFDCIGTRATAKNILTVGAIGDLENGVQDPGEVEMTEYSTFGPTDDGRIKPDLVGNGQALYSSYYESDQDYNTLSGTSMSAPNVAGSLALLQELHFIKRGGYMWSSSLKGLALHTADDAGNPGPDYKFGWGVLNSRSAAALINHDAQIIFEDTIQELLERRYTFYAPGDSAIKATLCWTDPRGPIVSASLDPDTPILVNDLDMRLIRHTDSTIYEPFVLDPEAPDAPAQTGDNFRDNIEQITLSNAEMGYYELVITHKGSLQDDLQHFSLIVEGLGNIYLADDTTYLDQNNGFIQVTDAPEYPANRSFVWLVDPANPEPISLHFNEFNTNNGDTLFVYDGLGRDSPLLGQFNGILDNPDTLLRSTGGSLFLEFRTGDEGGAPGFSGRYCTSPPTESLVIKGESYPCAGTEEVYFFHPLPESDYTWGYSENVSDSAVISASKIMVQVPEQLFTLTVTAENKCGTGAPVSLSFTPLTGPPDINLAISGDTLPCSTGEVLYAVQDEPGTSYWWTLPKGWIGNSDSSSIWVTPKEGSGIISVIPVNSCGESEKGELTIHPLLLPEIPVIESDRINPCENELQEFSTIAVEETGYVWRAPQGWEIQGPDSLTEVSVLVGTGSSGRMFLTVSNKCGETLTSRNFVLSPAPTAPFLRRQNAAIEGLDELVVLNYDDYTLVDWYRNDILYEGFHEESLILQRNGVYSIEVRNEEGCTATMKDAQKVEVSDQKLLYSIRTASDGLIIVQNDTPDPAQILAFDLTGRAAFADELQPGTNNYHTTRRGLIIIRIEGEKMVKTQMIFIH